MSVVSFSVSKRIATIRMHDPERRNALGEAMLRELCAAFDAIDPEVRAVVLRSGPEDKVWCAGFDIGALGPGRDPLAQAGVLQGLFRRVRACHAPVIGMLHGSAWGGGTDLALRCDLLVGDETASLAFTPARLGLPYDADGLLNAMLRAGPALAMEMFVTAEPVLAARAMAAGLLNRLVAAEALEEEVYGMAGRIADNAPMTVTSAKRHLQALAAALPLPAALQLPAALAQSLQDGRRAALDSADYAEGLAAFREKRAPKFSGA